MHFIGNLIDSALWWFRPPPVILLRLHQGDLQLRRGTVPRSVLDGMSQVLKTNDVTTASIWGYRRHDAVVLAFSREIPEAVRQQLRNVWNAR